LAAISSSGEHRSISMYTMHLHIHACKTIGAVCASQDMKQVSTPECLTAPMELPNVHAEIPVREFMMKECKEKHRSHPIQGHNLNTT
jgi:hypothetical protein